jgi:hypothetical protein
MTPERTTVRLLADKNGVQDSLSLAVERWTRKYGDKHPLEAKLTLRRALHDRAIFVDGKGAWVLASRLRWMSVARDSTANSAAQIAIGGRALGIQSNRCPNALSVFSRHAPRASDRQASRCRLWQRSRAERGRPSSERSIASKPFLRREETGESVTLRPAISRNVPGGIYEVTKQLPHNGREVRISLQKCKRRA